jgi:hypothetical protein
LKKVVKGMKIVAFRKGRCRSKMKQKLIMFFAFSIPFTIMFSLMYWWTDTNPFAFIIAGATFGLLMTVISNIVQSITVKKKGIKGPIHVRSSTRFFVEGSQKDVFDLCNDSIPAINKCKIGFYDPKQGLVRASVSKSWMSWGELITFQIKEIELNKYNLLIVSRPVLRTTIIDYGKNLDNINRISEHIKLNTKLIITQAS